MGQNKHLDMDHSLTHIRQSESACADLGCKHKKYLDYVFIQQIFGK